MRAEKRAITVANDETLSRFIRAARQRVVAMAPAFSKCTAEALRDRWAVLGAESVMVIVDVDPEVYRLGYGELAALELLEKAAADVGTTLNRHDGIRIAKIAEVKANLDRNPPQEFDIARTVRVFNAYFEFVDFELKGLQVHRRTAHIPSDLMGLAKDEKTQNKLQASFKLIDESSQVSGKAFQDCKKRLVNEYLTLLPGYGYVVLRAVKPKFERKTRQLDLAPMLSLVGSKGAAP